LSEHSQQLGADLVRIGAKDRGPPFEARKLRLAFAEQVQLFVTRHGGRIILSSL
jgi:hypothetical protein